VIPERFPAGFPEHRDDETRDPEEFPAGFPEREQSAGVIPGRFPAGFPEHRDDETGDPSLVRAVVDRRNCTMNHDSVRFEGW
jgi:hypothetical protein